MEGRIKSLFCLVLLSILLASCSIAPSVNKVQTEMAQPTKTFVFTLTDIPTPIPPTPIPPTATTVPTATFQLTPTSTPTAISPTPTAVLQADTILLNNGFGHNPEDDGVEQCLVEGCKNYDNISAVIAAQTNLDTGFIMISVNPEEEYTAQKTTLASVIVQMFGREISSWVLSNLDVSANVEQEEHILNGHAINILHLVLFTNDLTMIMIGDNE